MQSSLTSLDLPSVGKCISEFFVTTEIEALARETKLVRRRSKLTGTLFLQVLVFGFLKTSRASLKQLAQLCSSLGAWLTPQAIDERLSEFSVAFLKRMFERGFAVFRNQLPLPLKQLQRFTQINLVDSTILTLPDALADEYPGSGGSGPPASVKIQLVFDFLRGNVQQLVLQAGRATDQAYRDYLAVVSAGSLTLMDRGYFCLGTFVTLVERGAYFISRYLYPTKLSTPEGAVVNLLTLLQSTTAQEFEQAVLLGAKEQLAVRLIVVRVPPAVAEKRRQRLKEKVKRGKRKAYSPEYLALQDWSLWITNVPAAWLSMAHVRCLYRVRWQIELIFKLWKSYCGLQPQHVWRRERILTELYAKMLGILLGTYLSAPLRIPDAQWAERELSSVQAHKLLADMALQLLLALHDLEALTTLIMTYHQLLIRYGLEEKRKLHPNVYGVLAEAGLA